MVDPTTHAASTHVKPSQHQVVSGCKSDGSLAASYGTNAVRTQIEAISHTGDAELRWAAIACPWEESRHSGYLQGFEEAHAALAYAEKLSCPSQVLASLPSRLAGLRLFFSGDSLISQFAQSVLCQIRHQIGMVTDNITWLPRPNQYGLCHKFNSSQPLRHCQLHDGCVTFAHDVVVCYHSQRELCVARWAAEGGMDSWLRETLNHVGHGRRRVLVLATGFNFACTANDWQQLAVLKPPMESVVEVVYKDLNAGHFPTKGGVWQHDKANQSGWHCAPAPRGGDVNDTNTPNAPMRAMELDVVLPIVRRLGWTVLHTYDDDRSNAWRFHSTFAPQIVADSKLNHFQRSKRNAIPVDCGHWLLPSSSTSNAARSLPHISKLTRPKVFGEENSAAKALVTNSRKNATSGDRVAADEASTRSTSAGRAATDGPNVAWAASLSS